MALGDEWAPIILRHDEWQRNYNVTGGTFKNHPTHPSLNIPKPPPSVATGEANKLIPVRCTQTGGSAGSVSTACSFTYTIKQLDNTTVIETGVAVADNGNRKSIGAYTAGTYGTAFRDDNGDGTFTWKLMYVSEKPAGAACPP